MTGLQGVVLRMLDTLCSVATWLAANLSFVVMSAVSVGGVTLSVAADVANRNWQRYEPASSASGAILFTESRPKVALELLHELARFDVLVDQYIEPFAQLAHDIAPQLGDRQLDTTSDEGLTLLLLSKRRDFVRLFKPAHFSAFTLPTLSHTTLVVGPAARSTGLRENLLHEYVHYRLRRDIPGGLPLWFEEGLASYLSNVRFRRDPRKPESLQVELGHWVGQDYHATNRSPRYSVRRQILSITDKALRLEDLVQRRNLDGMPRTAVEQFYHSSHALVRYLYASAELDRSALAAALVLGTPSFPTGVDVDLAAAMRAIRRHYDTTAGATERFVLIAPAEVAIAQERLAPAQVRRSLAEAALLANPPAAAQLYEILAKEHPAEAWTWVGASKALRLQGKTAEAQAQLAVAQKLAPDSPAVLLEQAATRTTGCIVAPTQACSQAWRRAMLDLRDVLDHKASNYEAIYRLGIAHLYLGQPGEAQGYLQIAWQRVPWSPRVNYFVGESLRLTGDTRARWFLDGAQRWAASAFYEQAAAEALRLLPVEPVPAQPGQLLE